MKSALDMLRSLKSCWLKLMSEIDQLRAKWRLSGQQGGRSRSAAKRSASSANLAKARAKRWPGREQAREQVELAQARYNEVAQGVRPNE